MTPARLVTFALALAGCGTASMITRTDDGGVLVLDGPRAAAGDKARELMTARCGGPYTVTAEGDEFVAGKTEYRMRFRCGAAPGGPQSQDPPPDAPDVRVPDGNRIGL